ncbi:leucine-rich repeat domain-containing protein [Brachyspira intermedia]|uniref:leucine-rich repeat domain-containing protein n=1 Tax=Brachyspira intermedia TaxID=84377 RepID=UPI003004A0CE
MIRNIKYIFIIYLLAISCSNYRVTDPFTIKNSDNSNNNNNNDNISIIPEYVGSQYFIKASYTEQQIEDIVNKYFKNFGKYIIFLDDTKDNIDKNKTIETINKVVNKSAYFHNGVAVDLSRTDMTEISQNAFKANKNLIEIKLPSSLKIINSSAFESCERLKYINLVNSITDIKSLAFKDCMSLEIINITSKITTIANNSFQNCITLREVILPEGLTSIGDSAFNYCTSLESINFPSTLQSIGIAAFYSCKSLKNIKLNQGLTTISDNAFNLCSSLTDISLPESIKTLVNPSEGKVFSDCKMLQNVEYLGTDPVKILKENDTFLGSPAKDLYLPNVAEDPKNGSWDNFLAVAWKTIHYGKYMPK